MHAVENRSSTNNKFNFRVEFFAYNLVLCIVYRYLFEYILHVNLQVVTYCFADCLGIKIISSIILTRIEHRIWTVVPLVFYSNALCTFEEAYILYYSNTVLIVLFDFHAVNLSTFAPPALPLVSINHRLVNLSGNWLFASSQGPSVKKQNMHHAQQQQHHPPPQYAYELYESVHKASSWG